MNEFLKRRLGAEIRRRRKLKKMFQIPLADVAEINETYIGHIECGRKLPALPVLIRIAHALDTTAATILGSIGA